MSTEPKTIVEGKMLEKKAKPEICLTARSVVISIVFILILAYVNVHSMTGFLPYIDASNTVPSVPALGVLFLMLLINLLLSRVLPKLKFSDSENTVVYNMVSVGGMLTGLGLIMWLVFVMMSWQIDAGGRYRSLEYLLVVPSSRGAVLQFWLGTGRSIVPWEEWILPIIFWVAFYGVVLWVLVCMATIVYKQWSSVEHLTFPVAMPIILVIKNKTSDSEPFWSNRLMWLGAGISGIVFTGLGHLHHYFPIVPCIPPFNLWTFLEPFGEPWWSAIHAAPQLAIDGWMPFRPVTMGIMYFVSTDILFSIWFLTLAHVVYRACLVSFGFFSGGWTGWTDGSLAAPFELSLGGFIGLALFGLWVSREHIKTVVMSAVYGKAIDDSSEGLSYRTAFWGFVIGFSTIIITAIFFLRMQVIWAIFFFSLFILICLSGMRLRTEGGMPLHSPIGFHFDRYILTGVFGCDAVSERTRIGLGYLHPLSYGSFGILGANTLEAYKMSEEVGLKKKSMVKAIMIAFLVSTVAGILLYLPVIYNVGAIKLASPAGQWGSAMRWVFQRTVEVEQYSRSFVEPNFRRLVFTFLGVGLALGTGYLRSLYLWWPIHPIGIAMATNDHIGGFWYTAFLVWLVKVFVNRYGGASLLRKLQPFFVGLLLGAGGVEALFAVIGVVVALV